MIGWKSLPNTELGFKLSRLATQYFKSDADGVYNYIYVLYNEHKNQIEEEKINIANAMARNKDTKSELSRLLKRQQRDLKVFAFCGISLGIIIIIETILKWFH